MNILVTGGAGYIGKIFIEKYHKKFNKIYVIDNLYDSFNEGFPNNVIFLENEFGDQSALDKVFSNKIEIKYSRPKDFGLAKICNKLHRLW